MDNPYHPKGRVNRVFSSPAARMRAGGDSMDMIQRLILLSRHRRATTLVLTAAFFIAGLVAIGAFGAISVQKSLERQLANQIATFDSLEADLEGTFDALAADTGLVPCSPQFMHWIRRIAFLPDGVHELMYMEGRSIACSVTQGELAEPVRLGRPDIDAEAAGKRWLDRDLATLGFAGLSGTFVKKGNFGLVAPTVGTDAPLAEWIEHEAVTPLANGEWVRRGGTHHIQGGDPANVPAGLSFEQGAFHATACAKTGIVCLIARAPFGKVLAANVLPTAGGVVSAALLALLASLALQAPLRRFHALPSRFRSFLSVDTAVCHYQPILSLRTGGIDAVEVLARWRDIDGTLVFPDKFLDVIEREAMTRQFTEIVAHKAFAELSALPHDGRCLQVNFNIFPRDFDADWLAAVFADFLACPERFSVVVELVETDTMAVETMCETIANLRRRGIRTYIDDFGVGYSSIHYLAGLDADGVKLDRTFAMAPDGSLMATMLTSAIEMIAKTGQELVVEGVESRDRLMALRATNRVDHVQGYYVSRAVDAQCLAAFLATHQRTDEPSAGPAEAIALR